MKPMQNVTPNGPKGNADYSKWSFTYTGSYHNIVEGPNELTSKITCYDQGQNASSKFYSINVTGTKNGGEIANDTVQPSNENTDNEITNISPVKDNNSNSTNDTVQPSNENTDNEVTNISPVKDNSNKGKYKILPLYSGSNEEDNSVSSEDGDNTEVTSTDTSEPQDSHNSLGMDDTNIKTLNSEQKEGTQVISTDTSEPQDSHNSVEMGDTNTKTLSSERQEETEETAAYDRSKSQVAESTDEELSTDTNKYFTFEPNLQEELSTDTNKYFTFEPDLQEDEDLSENDNIPTIKTADSDSSLPNHYKDGNSIFGLKVKDLNEDTKNKLENREQRLEERLDDGMHVFGLIR
jgi:hypothetical protein